MTHSTGFIYTGFRIEKKLVLSIYSIEELEQRFFKPTCMPPFALEIVKYLL